MNDSGTYKIRPAGRLLLSIGRDLIRNVHSALLELVKNAYDADAPHVKIEITADQKKKAIKIVVSDDGHGMTLDTVVNKWMVPATGDKKGRKRSPKGRIMQGRKGVGRFASAVLGNDLFLETVHSGHKSSVCLEWDSFEKAAFLDDVDVLVEAKPTREKNGTRLTIDGDASFLEQWEAKQFEDLRFELKKMISPIPVYAVTGHGSDNDVNDGFRITLSVHGFDTIADIDEEVAPFPLYDLYDYKISGWIKANGEGELQYSAQKARNIQTEVIPWNSKSEAKPTGCGDLYFDIRVYDREAPAIEALIGRGLKDENGNAIGKNDAKDLLNRANGVGVYRNGFRISPLGDPDFDWLKLNEQRIQNPTMRIGSNQVIGCVQIQSEEFSHLEEKSARDGLKENDAYLRLVAITQKVIHELEVRRYKYRLQAELSRSNAKIEPLIRKVFSFEDIRKDVARRLPSKNPTIDEVKKAVDEAIGQKEKELADVGQKVSEQLAFYQGQATLGKIVNVVLHEGRRPLNYLKSQIPNLRVFHEQYVTTHKEEWFERLDPILAGTEENVDSFVVIFSRLDPFAAKRRSLRKAIPIKDILVAARRVLESVLTENGVEIQISGDQNCKISCWKQDMVAIFVNLIDNSMFWIREKGTAEKCITINITASHGMLSRVDYRDTGPGIDKDNIASGVIFEPGFSTKIDGMGLGLAIAGESADRNGLRLSALESDTGAYFRLQPKLSDE